MAADDSGTKAAGQAWWATVLTIFPELLPGPLAASLSGKALARGIWRLDVVDIRARATGRHASVDDQPFGGGPGMVMRPDVVDAALRAALAPGDGGEDGDGDSGEDGDGDGGEDGGGTGVESIEQDRPIIYLSTRGSRLDQSLVRRLAAGPGPVLICGRYEGVDQRVLDAWSVEEISLEVCMQAMVKEALEMGAEGVAEIKVDYNPASTMRFSTFIIPDWSATINLTGMAFRMSDPVSAFWKPNPPAGPLKRR